MHTCVGLVFASKHPLYSTHICARSCIHKQDDNVGQRNVSQFNRLSNPIMGAHIFRNMGSLFDSVNLIFSKCSTPPSSFSHIPIVGGLSDFQAWRINFLASNVDNDMAWTSYLFFTLSGSTIPNSAVRDAGVKSL